VSRCHSGMSHEEIGRVLGVTRSRVQQIEKSALQKLRAAFGSSYAGPWLIYDVEGVPEPGENFRTYERTKTQARTSGGRFSK
jgi:transcriptional regulator with XRE-family HTH domain